MLFLPIPSNHRVWSRFNFQLRLAHSLTALLGRCDECQREAISTTLDIINRASEIKREITGEDGEAKVNEKTMVGT